MTDHLAEQCSKHMHRAMLRGIATDVRTYGQTESITTYRDHMGFSDARAHMQDSRRDVDPQRIDPAAVAEELRHEMTVGWERMTVVRDRAERQELPKILRVLVLRRDNFTCQWCGVNATTFPGELFEVDHITPWSAGGVDASWNLRALCKDCNQRRGNCATDYRRASVLPIVTHCPTCDERTERYNAWLFRAEPETSERDTSGYMAAWCGRCGTGTTAPPDLIWNDPANRLIAGQPNAARNCAGCRSEAIAEPDQGAS